MAVKHLVNMTQTIAVEGINQTTLITATTSGVSLERYEFATADAAVFYTDVTAVTGSGTFQLSLQERDPATGLFYTYSDAPVFTGITAVTAGARTASFVPLGECYTLNWAMGGFTSVTFSCVAHLISWGR